MASPDSITFIYSLDQCNIFRGFHCCLLCLSPNLLVNRNFLNTYLNMSDPRVKKSPIPFLSYKTLLDMSPIYHQILQLQPLWSSIQACSPWPLSRKPCCCSLYLGHAFCPASSPVAHSIPSVPLSREASPTAQEHSHPIPHLLV